MKVWVVQPHGSADHRVFLEEDKEKALAVIEWYETLKTLPSYCDSDEGRWYSIDDGGGYAELVTIET